MFVFAFKNLEFTAKKLLACLFLLVFLAGCGSVESTEKSKSEAEPKPTSPQVTLTSSEENVAFNGSVTLTWGSADVSSCASSDNWSGSNAVQGSRTINGLTSDKVFSLSCSGVDGTAIAQVSVTVNEASIPTVMISASPVNLAYSGSTQLSWTSSNASSCAASGDWSGNRSTSGSTNISNLLSGKTYNLTCTGPGGSASDSVSITVAGPAASSVNLTASPSSLPFAGSTTLSWNSNNTTGCTASGDWSGSKVTSGSQTMSSLTSDKVFNLSCNGPGGTATDTVNITVAAPAPTLSFSVSPASVSQNGTTTLSWNSIDATSCVASGDWSGIKSESGSEIVGGLTTGSQFNLTCSGAGGSVNDTVTVTVAASAPTLSFSASPASVSQNGTTTLNWDTTSATSCTASGDWSGNKGTSGAETINSLTIDSQFVLTCSGTGGAVNETVNVTVSPTEDPTNGPAPLGAGFTELVPSSDTRIIYVSSSQGSDGNDGLTTGTPVATIAKGITLLRDGFPDWLLLRKGDTWYEALGQWKKSGRSASEPMVVSAYGPSTVRPLLKTGSGRAIFTNGSNGAPQSNNYLVFKGLHFYAHTRNPANAAEYTGTRGGNGLEWLRGTNFLLVEDNMFSFFEVGLSIQDVDGFGISNIYIRKNIITDSYRLDSDGHSQGLFMNGVTGALIEGNILDHNGWHDTISGAQKTVYNHGMYIQSNCRNISILDNIIMRSSQNGAQLRPGGQLNGNLLIENTVALLLAGDDPNVTGISVSDNVVLNGVADIPGASSVSSWGIDFNAITTSHAATAANNIVAHSLVASPSFAIESNANVTYSNNIVHDWGSGRDSGFPTDYVDPDRSIEDYNAFAGGPGTRAAFFAQLRAQSADNWNDDYSIDNIKLYFTEGFTLR